MVYIPGSPTPVLCTVRMTECAGTGADFNTDAGAGLLYMRVTVIGIASEGLLQGV